MGVKFLQTFVSRVGGAIQEMDLLHELSDGDSDSITLVIDFPALLYHLLSQLDSFPFDVIDGNDRALQAKFFEFSELLHRHGIKQLWVKDGYLNPNKTETQNSRELERMLPEINFREAMVLTCTASEAKRENTFLSLFDR